MAIYFLPPSLPPSLPPPSLTHPPTYALTHSLSRLREFLGLCTHLKIFPALLSRTRLSDIFKEANEVGDEADAGGHEFTFEEYKTAMVGIAAGRRDASSYPSSLLPLLLHSCRVKWQK